MKSKTLSHLLAVGSRYAAAKWASRWGYARGKGRKVRPREVSIEGWEAQYVAKEQS